MPSLPKLSFLLLALAFLVAPFFADAAALFWYNGNEGGDLRFPSLRASLGEFSLENLDTRLYELMSKGKNTQQIASHGCIYDEEDDEWDCPAACIDGHDNDEDGLTDYPADPGCSSPGDGDERGSIQCDNGEDNDGDGKIDYPADPGCSSPFDTSEFGTIQCDNDIDDDSDGAKDYKEVGGVWALGDIDCESPSDNYEINCSLLPPLGRLLCLGGTTRGLSGSPPGAVSPSVELYLDGAPSVNAHELLGDAYATEDRIYWNVQDSCGCVGTPGSWFTATLDGSGDSVSSKTVTISEAGVVAYSLSCATKPSCNPSANPNSDSVTITPIWSPSVNLCPNGSSDCTTEAAAGQRVFIKYSAADIRSCIKSWDNDNGTLVLSGGNPQEGTIDVGTISAPTRFSLSCDGFNASSPAPSPQPTGYLDRVSDTEITGWACDSSDFSSPIAVHFYMEGGVFIGSTIANNPAEAGVAAACGGYANHRFSFATPSSLRDGAGHSIYAYGINIPSGSNPQLGLSPKYFASHSVDFISNPTPYFFINSINLIIIGPGSGGRSNRATVGVTSGGGFTGSINLSAASPALAGTGAGICLKPAGAEPRISCPSSASINCAADGTCTTAELWVETATEIEEGTYTITLTADPAPSGFDTKTKDIQLKVRRFTPSFQEI